MNCNQNCPTCKRINRTCVMCQAEAERTKRPAPNGTVNPRTRVERDQEAQHAATAA
jgi:hypothetical protein